MVQIGIQNRSSSTREKETEWAKDVENAHKMNFKKFLVYLLIKSLQTQE